MLGFSEWLIMLYGVTEEELTDMQLDQIRKEYEKEKCRGLEEDEYWRSLS